MISLIIGVMILALTLYYVSNAIEFLLNIAYPLADKFRMGEIAVALALCVFIGFIFSTLVSDSFFVNYFLFFSIGTIVINIIKPKEPK